VALPLAPAILPELALVAPAPELPGGLTARQALATAAIAALEPERVSPESPGRPLRPPWSARTQRMCPARTSCASHATLTVLSRPENPPTPAMLAPWPMISEAALDWLATAIVPPPWRLT
jgi:hypothetical protein